jgi:hypothetical protein
MLAPASSDEVAKGRWNVASVCFQPMTDAPDHKVELNDHAVAADDLKVTVTITADGVVAPGPTDSLGLPVAKTYSITASPLAEDHYHYELRDPDGNVLVSGPGNELTDVLLGMAVELENKGKDA